MSGWLLRPAKTAILGCGYDAAYQLLANLYKLLAADSGRAGHQRLRRRPALLAVPVGCRASHVPPAHPPVCGAAEPGGGLLLLSRSAVAIAGVSTGLLRCHLCTMQSAALCRGWAAST